MKSELIQDEVCFIYYDGEGSIVAWARGPLAESSEVKTWATVQRNRWLEAAVLDGTAVVEDPVEIIYLYGWGEERVIRETDQALPPLPSGGDRREMLKRLQSYRSGFVGMESWAQRRKSLVSEMLLSAMKGGE